MQCSVTPHQNSFPDTERWTLLNDRGQTCSYRLAFNRSASISSPYLENLLSSLLTLFSFSFSLSPTATSITISRNYTAKIGCSSAPPHPIHLKALLCIILCGLFCKSTDVVRLSPLLRHFLNSTGSCLIVAYVLKDPWYASLKQILEWSRNKASDMGMSATFLVSFKKWWRK